MAAHGPGGNAGIFVWADDITSKVFRFTAALKFRCSITATVKERATPLTETSSRSTERR